MIFTETCLHGAYIIEPEPRKDERGFFARVFCEREFEQQGIRFRAVQANLSYNSRKQTLRGMHFNNKPDEEAKVITCVRGGIFDVIVDIRPQSASYRQWMGVELSAENRKMLYIPKGFAHGFITLTDHTAVHYHMSDFYKPGSAGGFRWNDPAIGINWPVQVKVISHRDREWPMLTEIK